MIDLGRRAAPSEVRLEIRQASTVGYCFVRIIRVNQVKELVEPILNGPVVAEAGFRGPLTAASDVANVAAVECVRVDLRIVDVIARSLLIRYPVTIRDAETAVVAE